MSSSRVPARFVSSQCIPYDATQDGPLRKGDDKSKFMKRASIKCQKTRRNPSTGVWELMMPHTTWCRPYEICLDGVRLHKLVYWSHENHVFDGHSYRDFIDWVEGSGLDSEDESKLPETKTMIPLAFCVSQNSLLNLCNASISRSAVSSNTSNMPSSDQTCALGPQMQ